MGSPDAGAINQLHENYLTFYTSPSLFLVNSLRPVTLPLFSQNAGKVVRFYFYKPATCNSRFLAEYIKCYFYFNIIKCQDNNYVLYDNIIKYSFFSEVQ